MSQKRRKSEQARARRKRRRHERETDYLDGLLGAARLDYEPPGVLETLEQLEAVGLAERCADGWRRTDRSPAEVSLAEALVALERLEAERAEAEQAEVDAAAEALGWLDYR